MSMSRTQRQILPQNMPTSDSEDEDEGEDQRMNQMAVENTYKRSESNNSDW